LEIQDLLDLQVHREIAVHRDPLEILVLKVQTQQFQDLLEILVQQDHKVIQDLSVQLDQQVKQKTVFLLEELLVRFLQK
jgi:hypothetical protein